jgi:hypothetical protein
MKGGFYVGPLADTELGVTETYSCVEVDGAAQPGAGMSNRWDFKFLSDTLRVCRAVDGSLRVYEKLEADVALAELASLRTEEIEIDPEAFMEDEVEAFWCFQQLMQQVEPNFHKDQNGMHRQLEMLQVLTAHLDPELLAYLQSKDCSNFYFCFRWLPLQALAPLLLLFLLLLLGT